APARTSRSRRPGDSFFAKNARSSKSWEGRSTFRRSDGNPFERARYHSHSAMRPSRPRRLLLSAIAVFVTAGVWASAHAAEQWHGVLDEHPLIQYASRPTTDRMGALTRAVADGTATLVPDAKTGYLTPVLRALGIPTNTQVLVFSKTG